MKKLKYSLAIVCLTFITNSYAQTQKGFTLIESIATKKVEVRYSGKLLTAYCYFDSTEKPVLFPIKTFSGVTITRGFPIVPRVGERADHPHHVGLWLNYESINGIDFWNNSSAILTEKKSHYGSIRHQKIISSSAQKDKAVLETQSVWVNYKGEILLEETTKYIFSKNGDDFIIDRITNLEAKADKVLFKDVKDGMLGLRVARELELPSDQADEFIDAHGNKTAVTKMNNEKVTGNYISENGLQGNAVWGTRSKWVVLNGKKENESISIAIIDHPQNIGYPTYWHARGYGLFAANPLGQAIFSKREETLNFSLKKSEQTTFHYRIVIHSGTQELTLQQINFYMSEFITAK